MGITLRLWSVKGETTILFEGDVRGSVVAPDVLARDIAARVADEVPAAIRDRCYSLVQSMAGCAGDPQPREAAYAWADEAYAIAKGAGWVK